ncbi:MAG TPA: hypothetical protein VN843_33995 [Anaerolineales bacterium]|nr:hypothetical protein [Anaerolineales bacterium]
MTSTAPITSPSVPSGVDQSNQQLNEQMQKQLTALLSRISALEHRNQELENKHDEHHSGPSMGVANGTSHSSAIKAAKPAMYSGDIGSDVEAWLFQALQYAYITNIPEENRAKWAATYLTGKAGTWWRGLVMQTHKGNIDEVKWNEFYCGLVRMFKPVNAKKIARDKLAALRQTHSVAKYNYDITQLFLEIGDVSDGEKLDRYIRGLKDKIRMEVELAEPTTLAQAMAKAQRVDGITYHAKLMHNMDHMGNNAYHTSTDDYSPMDLGMVHDDYDRDLEPDTLNVVAGKYNKPRGNSRGKTMSSTTGRGGRRTFTTRQRESPEVYKHCQEQRLCLNCKEPGHIARGCTKSYKPLNMTAH